FCVLGLVFFFFFFFQAEDGIRDLIVTGVQTCALPISFDSQLHGRAQDFLRALGTVQEQRLRASLQAQGPNQSDDAEEMIGVEVRSEERRVGKECRSGWWADQ